MEGIVMHLTCMYYRRAHFSLLLCFANEVHYFLSLVFFCLRADVSYFLCYTRERDVCVTPSLIVFQRSAGFPRSWEHAVIG